MSTSINYKITKIWASPKPINNCIDVVGNVFFTITATDSDSNNIGVFEGIANLPEPLDSSEFVDYDQLTEQQLITWVKERFGTDAIELMENQAIQSITVNKSLPWK